MSRWVRSGFGGDRDDLAGELVLLGYRLRLEPPAERARLSVNRVQALVDALPRR